jgi:hypothetical protein
MQLDRKQAKIRGGCDHIGGAIISSAPPERLLSVGKCGEQVHARQVSWMWLPSSTKSPYAASPVPVACTSRAMSRLAWGTEHRELLVVARIVADLSLPAWSVRRCFSAALDAPQVECRHCVVYRFAPATGHAVVKASYPQGSTDTIAETHRCRLTCRRELPG